MPDYRLRIQLLGPQGTPWQSDTLFGHLVWQVALGRCDIGVEEFLAPFRAGRPPFALSDGFPAGLLPRPTLAPPRIEEALRRRAARPRSPHDYAAEKKRRKSRWMTAADYRRLRQGQIALDALPPAADPIVEFATAHASLDRRTLRTGGDGAVGQFFETEGWALDWSSYPERRTATAEQVPPTTNRGTAEQVPPTTYPGDHDGLDLYLRAIDDAWAARAEALLRELAHAGYGRDASTGTGAFAVLDRQPAPEFSRERQSPDWPVETAPSCFMTLSTWIPAPGDPPAHAWRLRVKRGKFAHLGGAAGANPFKRPIMQLEPGATGSWPEGLDAPILGRLLTGIGHSPRADHEPVQAGFAIAAPLPGSANERQ